MSFLENERPQRRHPLKVGYFHLGADFANRSNAQPLSGDNHTLDRAMQSRPSLLMVGTVEPRKGHQLALAAVEKLWAAGIDLNLVIVGKQGWNVDAVSKKLRAHRESSRRLFWLSDTSDETLARLYQTSSALLAASEGEGFGIPLIEAARHKLPIIARDIPVFREVAGDCAFYFGTGTPDSLAADLRSWLDLYSKAAAPSSEGLRFLTWKESAEQLANVVLGKRIYKEWMPQLQLEKPPSRSYGLLRERGLAQHDR
jgi:glycosyltransferase involved in cell wall biosynthesis